MARIRPEQVHLGHPLLDSFLDFVAGRGRVEHRAGHRVRSEGVLLDEKLWLAVQGVNQQAEAKASRGPDGKLKSRPTASKWLLSPFIACGVCGGSMHAKKSGKNYRYVCTARHTWGAPKCSNPSGLAVTIADKVLLDGLCDYRKVLAELGLDAVTAVLEEAATKPSASPARRAGRSRR